MGKVWNCNEKWSESNKKILIYMRGFSKLLFTEVNFTLHASIKMSLFDMACKY